MIFDFSPMDLLSTTQEHLQDGAQHAEVVHHLHHISDVQPLKQFIISDHLPLINEVKAYRSFCLQSNRVHQILTISERMMTFGHVTE